MSWIDNINNVQLKIVTGEGSEFTPLWKGANRSIDFNASVFSFNEVEGDLVRRGKASSFRFPIELHFGGDNYIDEVDRFMIAARDQRPWTLTHPNYGNISVQPITLNQNDNFQNNAVVTGELYETIEDTFPDSTPSAQAVVLESVNNAQQDISDDFESVDVDAALTNDISSGINNITDLYELAASTTEDLQAVKDKSNEVITAFANISNEPVVFMNRLTELIRTPALFYKSVIQRLTVIKESYEQLKTALVGLISKSDKIYFEAVGGAHMIAYSETCVILAQEIADAQGIENNTIIDYETRSQVVDVIVEISILFNDYIDQLGELQSEVDATLTSYTPSQNTVNAVKESINLASGQLFQIASGTKQERIYTNPKAENLVILTHRLLGNIDNATIEGFVNLNNLQLDELIQIPEGKELKYYI